MSAPINYESFPVIVDKTCARCNSTFRDATTEPFITCHACRRPDTRDRSPMRFDVGALGYGNATTRYNGDNFGIDHAIRTIEDHPR